MTEIVEGKVPDPAWQIGSKAPPRMCLCCGFPFDDGERKIHGPFESGPYRYVCDWCYRKPFLYFPGKVGEGDRWYPPGTKHLRQAKLPLE